MVIPERRHTSALARTYLQFCAEREPALLTPLWRSERGGPAAS